MGGSAAAKADGTRSLWLFQSGRLAGYSAMGALAAASMQGLGWLSVHSASLRPVWSLLHVAAALLGLMLLVQARQPVWLELGARHVWSRIRSAVNRPGKPASPTVPLVLGVAWSLLPCGLLYSALLVAALSANPAEGAGVMALFAVGSGLSLMAGPWLWLRLRGPGSGQWAIRLAGAALLASSAWALWMGLVHDAAPWCITP
jgi:sulfite exporter TauE/SafE